MHQYKKMLKHVLDNGYRKGDRTKTGTIDCFGVEARFDLSEGFPIDSLKKVFFEKALIEWLWMVAGGRNIRPLLEHKVSIWTDWPLRDFNKATGRNVSKKEFEAMILGSETLATAWGDLGPVYGAQWRAWRAPDGRVIDQVAELQRNLVEDPNSRRHILEGWNVGELAYMALPPCHKTYQFDVTDGKLSLYLHQRSGDMFLGVPFNQVAGGLWLHAMAQATGLKPGTFIHFVGSAHIYANHLDQVEEALSREPKPFPKLILDPGPKSIFDFREEHFRLEGYDPHPHIAAPVAV